MDALFMNSENSKTSDPCMLVLNLTNKIILKRSNRILASLNLVSAIHGKIQKSNVKTKTLSC